jgi:uncharacterized protein YbaR (Trm112 family)
MLAATLVDVLVCPKSKRPMIYFPRGEHDRDEADAVLVCPASRLAYRIEAGVPVLLVDEARELSAEDVVRFVARAGELGLRVPG